jgi:uncharacterized membrane protein
MWLQYHNARSRGLFLAIGYYSPGCADGGDWAKKGWWRIEPGQTARVLWTTNRYSYFYAESDDGAVWSGVFTTAVPVQAFDWCWNTASTSSRDIGMRQVEHTNPGLPWIGTINLT